MKSLTQSLFQLISYFILASGLVACSGSGGDPGGPRNPKADLASIMISNTNSFLEDPDNFQPDQTYYTATVNFVTSSVKITPEVLNPGSTVTIDGQSVNPGSQSQVLPLAEGVNTIDIIVTAADNSISRTYTIDITRLAVSSFTDIARLASIAANNNDVFGTQISLSDDILAVGIPSTSSSEAGSVQIFERNSGGFWIYRTTITASNADNGDKFGTTVSVSGDTLVVGAPFEDSKAIGINGDKFDEDIIVDGTGATTEGNIGAAYVYIRTPGTSIWTEQAYLKPASTVKNIHRNIKFGTAVAIDGDTAAVSAEFEKSNATGVNGDLDDRSLVKAGAVYVFTRNGINWSQQAYIKASNTDEEDRFGGSIALSGDTLAVGARFEDSSATGINGNQSSNASSKAGAVYVFTRNGINWAQQAYIKASNTNPDTVANEEFDTDDQFGRSLAIDGDTLAVGATHEDSYAAGVATNVAGAEADNSIPNSGAVYIFSRNGSTWEQQAYLKSANPDIAGNFGWSVAVSGDMVAVGAIGELSGTGAVHYFTRSGIDWTQQDPVYSNNPAWNYHFGLSVVLEGDTMGASAPDEGVDINDQRTFQGAVYMMK